VLDTIGLVRRNKGRNPCWRRGARAKGSVAFESQETCTCPASPTRSFSTISKYLELLHENGNESSS